MQIWTVAKNVLWSSPSVTATLQSFTVDCAAIFPYYSIFEKKRRRKKIINPEMELQEMFSQREKVGEKPAWENQKGSQVCKY